MFRGFPDVLASDHEREVVADFLKGHYAAGRLTEDELSARVAAVYRARYDSQLLALTTDLPALPEPVVAPSRMSQLRPLAAAVLALVALVLLADAVPAEMWTLFFVLVVPMLVMVVVMLAPFVLPVLGIAWVARVISRPQHEQHALPGHRRALR